MKFTIICVVLISVCNIAQSDESADAAAASDYYAKFYQDYYNSIAGREDTDRDTGYSEPAAVYHEPVASYGYGDDGKFDLANMLGPDPSFTLALVSGAFGLLGLIGVLINAGNINNLSEDQDSICTTARGIGGTAFAALDATAVTGLNDAATVSTAGTQLQAIITQLNAITTPDC